MAEGSQSFSECVPIARNDPDFVEAVRQEVPADRPVPHVRWVEAAAQDRHTPFLVFQFLGHAQCQFKIQDLKSKILRSLPCIENLVPGIVYTILNLRF